MNYNQFILSLENEFPPNVVTGLLVALWRERKGKWDKAQTTTQKIHTKDAALIHAYLQFREGNLPNANYWYRSAGKLTFNGNMDDEWTFLVKRLL